LTEPTHPSISGRPPQQNIRSTSQGPRSRQMLPLELLGTLPLRDETRPVPVAAQQKRPLGLLAILGLGAKPGLLRDRIEAYLWPESSGARAQHALDQTVYAIRHALASDVILATGRELRDRKSTRLNSSHVAISYAVFCLKKKRNWRKHVEMDTIFQR